MAAVSEQQAVSCSASTSPFTVSFIGSWRVHKSCYRGSNIYRKDGDMNMFMTANRIMLEGKPLLKLNIHEYDRGDIAFLDSLGIDQLEGGSADCRYILIHSQEDFYRIRSAILQRYKVLEEKGPKVFLEAK